MLLTTSCAVNSMSRRAFARFDTAFFLFVLKPLKTFSVFLFP